jgi:arginyl-tRNA--protein-N-Asp/Glu arginylyltransferase
MADEPDKLQESAPQPTPRVLSSAPSWIEESRILVRVTPEEMDHFWAGAWRHFGPLFVRYSVSLATGKPLAVQPLRIVLESFQPSRGQRRILQKNADLEVRIQPPTVDAERSRLFEIHKRRFTDNIPMSLMNYLGPLPGVVPCETVEVGAFDGGRLVAASYLDVGREGTSSIYGMFDPAYGRRSLGIATMLWEMDYARKRGCKYYYPGYAFHEPSSFDYKKQFTGMEWYDWKGNWLPL